MKKLLCIVLLINIVLLVSCSRTNKEQNKNQYTYFYLEEPTHLVADISFEIIEKRNEPVLRHGEKGEWDGVDLLNPSIILKDGILYNYYSGFDGSVWRTGLATSYDGIKWKKYQNNPVLDLDKNGWDSTYIAANGAAVQNTEKIFYYYQGSDKNGLTQIGLAISEDGKTFKKYEGNPLLTVGPKHTWDSVAVADPYVIKHKDYFYMYYLGMDDMSIQRLGVARSKDGIVWERSLSNPILDVGAKGTFDENGLGEPSVIYYPPYFYMIYTGRDGNEKRNLGLAASLDGINWKKMSTTGLVGVRKVGTWDDSVICDPALILDEDYKLKIWYGGGNKPSPDEHLNGNVGLMIASIDQKRDLRIFDVNNMKGSVVDTRDILKGSYGIEGENGKKSVWISGEANITLLNKKDADGLSVKGYIPYSAHKQANKNLEEVIVTFYINSNEIKNLHFKEDKPFDITINWKKLSNAVGSNDFFDFKIQVNNSFIPAKAGLSPDKRNLSILINYIGVK